MSDLHRAFAVRLAWCLGCIIVVAISYVTGFIVGGRAEHRVWLDEKAMIAADVSELREYVHHLRRHNAELQQQNERLHGR